MKIGYACLTVGVPNTDLKTCLLKNASAEKLSELISHNLKVLENMIDYNVKNEIGLFRISSSVIPFGSSPVNQLRWWEMFGEQLNRIGTKINNGGLRVSMHPGQYTVLNAIDGEIVKKAIADLNYHACFLDALGVGTEHKIVLHLGGKYESKQQGLQRFGREYQQLDEAVRKRLVIENDDKSYTIGDVLKLGNQLNIPVVYDTLHNQANPCAAAKSDYDWIAESAKTWKRADGRQKIHYAQQHPAKKPGSHADSIRIDEFMTFYQGLKDDAPDVMLEVKDKNLSAIKCSNCIAPEKKIKALELEWSKYKYAVLERSPLDYLEIRKLLNNKSDYPALDFYHIIENALQKETTTGNAVNVAQHIWGYFRNSALPSEKKYFLKLLERYENGEASLKQVKKNLWKMAVKYEQQYLLESYYYEMV
jgi:UV DNA damage endonuclease